MPLNDIYFHIDSRIHRSYNELPSENLVQKRLIQKSSHLVRDKKQAVQQDFSKDFLIKSQLFP